MLDEALRLHIHLEESLLLPHYREVQGLPPNAAPEIFEGDHRKVQDALEHTAITAAARDPVATQAALAALAGLLEHHDERERRWFVPALNAHLCDTVRVELLAQVAAEMEVLEGAEPPPTTHADQLAAARALIAALQIAAASGFSSEALAPLRAESDEALQGALHAVDTHLPDIERVHATHRTLRTLWHRMPSADPIGIWNQAVKVLSLLEAHERWVSAQATSRGWPIPK